MDYPEKNRRWLEYIEALEEERQKMQVFCRELPLSIQIVSQAIDGYRQQMATESLGYGRSDCEETSSDLQPVLEEFIPLKRSVSSSEKDGEEEVETVERCSEKPDWLRSVQLWNQEPDLPSNEESTRKPDEAGELMKKKKKVGGAFHPFHGDPKTTATSGVAGAGSAADACSLIRRREEKDGRKSRRCWSPELHRRFLNALQQLGGSHVATPKQIKEIMKVDGLTNDEVKSHLQKYRLHNRRPAAGGAEGAACSGSSSSANTKTQRSAPQFIMVGGVVVPAPEYSAATAKTEPTVYAPVARLPSSTTLLPAPAPAPTHEKAKQASQRSPTSPLPRRGSRLGGHEGVVEDHAPNSSSSTTSSSSHTTSPAC